jgi:hypothetical protein
MANRNAPSGMKVVRHAGGGEGNRLSRHHIASALASNIFRGDAVIPVNTAKNINVATAGATLIGVFDGVQYIDSSGDVQFRPKWATGTVLKTGSVADAWVYDDPATLFEIQSSQTTVITDVGIRGDVDFTVAGNANGTSGMQMGAIISTSDGQLKIIDLLERSDNAIGLYAKWLVQIAEHYNGPSLTGI